MVWNREFEGAVEPHPQSGAVVARAWGGYRDTPQTHGRGPWRVSTSSCLNLVGPGGPASGIVQYGGTLASFMQPTFLPKRQASSGHPHHYPGFQSIECCLWHGSTDCGRHSLLQHRPDVASGLKINKQTFSDLALLYRKRSLLKSIEPRNTIEICTYVKLQHQIRWPGPT